MNDLSVESIKALAKQQREHFAEQDKSVYEKLKKDFVVLMGKTLERGDDSLKITLPYRWESSEALRTIFFTFLTEIGATWSVHCKHAQDPVLDRTEYYLIINCQGV